MKEHSVKYILKLLSLVLALSLLALPLAGCASHKRPLAYLKSSLERTLGQSVPGEMLSLLLACVEQGSIDLSVSGDHALGGATALDLTLFFDAQGEELMADVALLAGEKSFDAESEKEAQFESLIENEFKNEFSKKVRKSFK